MLTYAHWAPADAIDEVEQHVRAHLSSIASANDDPDVFAGEVRIERTEQGDGVLLTGYLDRSAAAAYLSPDWTPEQDIADNPLTVESIEATS